MSTYYKSKAAGDANMALAEGASEAVSTPEGNIGLNMCIAAFIGFYFYLSPDAKLSFFNFKEAMNGDQKTLDLVLSWVLVYFVILVLAGIVLYALGDEKTSHDVSFYAATPCYCIIGISVFIGMMVAFSK